MILTHLVMFSFFAGASEAAEVEVAVEDIGGGWLNPEQATQIRKRLKDLSEAQEKTREDRIAARAEFKDSISQTLDLALNGEPEQVREVAKVIEKEAAKALTIDPVIDLTPVLDQLRQIEETLRQREQLKRDDDVILLLLLAA